MAKIDRYFEIIQILRQARSPVLAQSLADALEVSTRTIYRDIAALQAMQIPIIGEAGVGYVMRSGYDLPPVNFDYDEAEAVCLGLSMVARTGDAGLWKAAQRAARKLNGVAPGTPRLVASSFGIDTHMVVDIADLRQAIRRETKMAIDYKDASDRKTRRTLWPLVLVYYMDTALLVGWCELRMGLRHFRLDRILNCRFLTDSFEGRGAELVAEWEQTQKTQTVLTQAL